MHLYKIAILIVVTNDYEVRFDSMIHNIQLNITFEALGQSVCYLVSAFLQHILRSKSLELRLPFVVNQL